jgi:hypothetical protein
VAIREKYHCIATGIIDELGVAKFPADFGAVTVRATHILPSTWLKLAEARIVGSLIAHLIKMLTFLYLLEAEQTPHFGFAHGLEWFQGGRRNDCHQERIIY